jgi:hypothetical protein
MVQKEGVVRITAIQVEMDGNDAGAIVRGLTEAMQGRPAQPVAAVAEVLALPAPAVRRNGRKNGYHKGTKAQRTAEVVGKPMGISEAIRMAVRGGPKTNEQILDFCRSHGADTNSSTVSTILCQMRHRNEIFKSDQDLKWRPAQKPE